MTRRISSPLASVVERACRHVALRRGGPARALAGRGHRAPGRVGSAVLLALCLVSAGCSILPDVAHQPVIRNPFPELSRVAVAPFFNLSDVPTLDGHRFALAYFAELQATPGYEVVPVSVVETAMREHRIQLAHPDDARRLARILEVDCVVVGAVTDWQPYYPPRCAMQVTWWSADPCLKPIPAGFGLPWGTAEEEYIPEPLVFEAQMASARSKLAAEARAGDLPAAPPLLHEDLVPPVPDGGAQGPQAAGHPAGAVVLAAKTDNSGTSSPLVIPESIRGGPSRQFAAPQSPPPGTVTTQPLQQAECAPTGQPVLSHTQIYHGHDRAVTDALATYFFFRNDARFGGWQSYLQRSEDFIRFCCHMHISEMLSARGGAAETRVVWEWPHSR